MTRRRTLDLQSHMAAQAQQHPVYTVEQLGPNRRVLPNGNLLCLNVPIARVGWLVYGPGEVPVKPGSGGVAYVERTHDALFSDQTVSSFMGAAVTDNHPPEDVTPHNFTKYSGGFAINVRRGSGADADVLLADLMITRKETIDAILAGKVEVSAGYDADYEDLGNGAGKQRNLIGNHIAIVPKGRCGPRCAIGDEEYSPNPPLEEGIEMTTRVKHAGASRRATLDEAGMAALRQRVTDAQADLEAAESNGDDQEMHIHIHEGGTRTTDEATNDRIAALEESQSTMLALVQGIAATLTTRQPTKDDDSSTDDAAADPDEEDDGDADGEESDDPKDKKKVPAKDKKTRDSAALHTSYQTLISQAEVLVPGFKVPTFDAASTRATTVDRMCSARKLCLSQFATTDMGAAMLTGLNGGKALDVISMDCAQSATLFKTAATAKAASNNAAATSGASAASGRTTDGATVPAKGMPTIAEINEANRKFWAGK